MPDIIALELDMTQEEVMRIIQKENSEEERKKINAKKVSDAPLLSKFYLDEVVSINKAIKLAQSRMWGALKVGSEFNISMEETQDILQIYAKSKVTLVILHADLVESTRLLMTLPVDRLATIIQAFSQEMSLMIAAYGGYVLKYVGDAILAFFVVDSRDLYLPSINAVNCACSMIKVIREGINPILNQYDYPELNVRIGIDVGENAVVQYGWETLTVDEKILSKKAHLDILGYTLSIATKMTALAKPDQIIIGQLVYEVLQEKQKSTFRLLPINPLIWNYSSSNTGDIYHLYVSLSENETTTKGSLKLSD
jgi:class 3 adenylate cyclase